MKDASFKRSEEIISDLITSFGEDIEREGLKETPKRVSKMYQELLRGYEQNPEDVFKVFDTNGHNGMIVISNIEFYSLCEHHMIPFFGRIHIGYIPKEKILGLSKFARLVEIYSKRLQLQERLTSQVADALHKYLKPKGVIVYSEAEHLCISMRGVKNNNNVAKTIVTRGIFVKNNFLVNQFLTQITKI